MKEALRLGEIPTQLRADPLIWPEGLSVEVGKDSQRFNDLLVTTGIPQDRINNYSLVFGSNNPTARSESITWGEYDKDTKEVIINLGTFIDVFAHTYLSAKVLSLTDRGINEEILNPLLVTKRLPQYLKSAPSEKSAKFVIALLNRSMQRKLRENIAHEVSHLHDDEFPKGGVRNRILELGHKIRHADMSRGISVFAGAVIVRTGFEFGLDPFISGAIGIVAYDRIKKYLTISQYEKGWNATNEYFSRPGEKRARKMAETLGKSEAVRGIITVDIKPSKAFQVPDLFVENPPR